MNFDIKTQGKEQFFPLMPLCCEYIMSGCSHCKHNNITSSYDVMLLVWTQLYFKMSAHMKMSFILLCMKIDLQVEHIFMWFHRSLVLTQQGKKQLENGWQGLILVALSSSSLLPHYLLIIKPRAVHTISWHNSQVLNGINDNTYIMNAINCR